jgi:fatty acid amide hydrolase 2
MRYLCTGPIARRAEDLWPLLRVLSGARIPDPATVDLRGMDVLTVEGDGRIAVSPDLLAAQRRAAEALAARGARVRPARFEGLSRSVEIWSAALDAAGGPSFRALLGQGVEIPLLREIARWTVGRSPHTLPALVLAVVEQLPKLLPDHAAPFVALGVSLKRDLVEQIGPHGVMLYPSHPRPAPFHYQSMFPPWNWGYTAVLNIMELPVTQVPLGLDGAGVPLGVQVASAPGQDHLTLAVALELERAFGGWVPPPIARGDS